VTSRGRRRVVALVLAVAGVLAALLAARDSATATATHDPAAATPLWSPRRVPQAVASGVGGVRLQAALGTIAADPSSCFVVEANGVTVASKDPTAAVDGASTQKLLVAAAALASLGPDTTFVTRVVAPAAVDGGSVDRLYLVGGGDPVLATDDYTAWLHAQAWTRGDVTTSLDRLADAIVARGVRHVPGGVVGDDSRYDAQRYLPSWPVSYRTEGDIGPMSALQVDDGFRSFVAARTGADDPALDAASRLAALLRARGVDVGASSHAVTPASAATEIATIASPPLHDIVASMLTSSDNQTAELLVKELGVKTAHEGSTAAGAHAVLDQLAQLGVPTTGVILDDGSGLDRGDRVTCATLVATLGLTDRPALASLLDGLPVAGRTGTLFDQLRGTSLVDHLKAKTGSLNGVSGFTGTLDVGPRLRFAFVDNGSFPDAAATTIRDRVARALSTFPDAPAITTLVPAPA
jgi:D-alanyl-D-alanine carboxypeptidase/D-alanyl-D-alanine-endopeptidase (penicillin-binding protein 4)